MTPYVYSPDYAPDFWEHVFPVEKYRLVAQRLGAPLETPRPATREELLLVHTPEYLDLLERLTETPEVGFAMFEIPCTRQVLNFFTASTGGTILAARLALEHGAAGHVGGGFHHAFADHGEGFCLLNDLAVAIRVLQREKLVTRVAVIDLDLHQGNGTAAIFEGDPDVYTFSVHQEHLYPIPKMRSTWDIGLDAYTSDDAYLKHVRFAVPKILDEHKPDLVVYQAGADPFEEDQLGRLKISKAGLKTRDEIVVSESRKRGIPIVATLGGGYARRMEDVVDIHTSTLLSLRSA